MTITKRRSSVLVSEEAILKNGWILPIIATLLIDLLFPVVYLLAVLTGSVPSWLPFASEAGAYAPAACVFSQAMTLASFTELLMYIARHRQVQYLIIKAPLECEKSSVTSQNNIATVLGLIHALSFPSVGNFRLKESPGLHALSAILTISALTSNILSTIQLEKEMARLRLETYPRTMVVNGYLLIGTGVILGVTALVSLLTDGPDTMPLKYSTIHNVSAAFEWVMFAQFSVHMICLARQMRKFV